MLDGVAAEEQQQRTIQVESDAQALKLVIECKKDDLTFHLKVAPATSHNISTLETAYDGSKQLYAVRVKRVRGEAAVYRRACSEVLTKIGR